MDRDSKLPGGRRVWETIRSVFTGGSPSRMVLPSRIPIVALMLSEQDRHVLTGISDQESLGVHFAESFDQACTLANQLTAPVVLFDRNWPGADWRKAVERLAALPHHTCVILMSAVADDYLRQELVRQGGYDVLVKPLRADNVARALKLALSYWNSTINPTVPG